MNTSADLRSRTNTRLDFKVAKSHYARMQSIRILCLILLTLLPPVSVVADTDYPPRIKSIVEQRCMVCHGCYDAPCQLKLDALAGLQRGAHKEKVYDGTRLITAQLTRLFEDAHSVDEWREKGFFPALGNGNKDIDLLTRMLELKQKNPLPAGKFLPEAFDLRLNREQQCAKQDEFDTFAQDHPLWGMPYALPGLTPAEHTTLTNWLGDGAAGVASSAPTAAESAALAQWETFLNGDSLKQQLMARYIYEHLFVGGLYFSDLDTTSGFFTLVRSRTAPGEPIDNIATRRPYDSPGKDKFYYRLQPLRTAVLDKRHMPYALSRKRMQHWQSLFVDAEYTLTALPSYKTEEASNPFITFRDLPQRARYRFMLEEAQFTIMGFIKGPVCRGQVALNVIDDHFWVVFMDPDRENAERSAEFLAKESDNLHLPSGKSNILVSLVDWVEYAHNQMKFLTAKHEYIKKSTEAKESKVNLDLIWNGDGYNQNMSLTIFRHNDSASVVKGLVGQQPKTAWVIDYSLLERIHYLLVAGFDVYGNVGHQLETRLYMDFLRMEGEQNFLFFLPAENRIALRDFWYRGAWDQVKQFVFSESAALDRDTDIVYATDDPKRELMDMLAQRQPQGAETRYKISAAPFKRLAMARGAGLSLMPEVAFVQVLGSGGKKTHYSIIHNSAFTNNTHLFLEEQRRLPEEDYLTIVKGFIGSYPNIFFQFPEADLDNFVTAVAQMRTKADYTQLVTFYGVRRNAPWFWRVSDTMYADYQQIAPIEAGLFDLNRYENR